MKNQLDITSGGDVIMQTTSLLQSFKTDDKQQIAAAANISGAYVSAAKVVAMKADLGIPWDKLRKLSR